MSIYDTYIPDSLVEENGFLRKENIPLIGLPVFESARETLPQPFWQGHGDVIAGYWRAWEIAFSNLCQPTPENGFRANYIDTAFNGCIFMWDSAFILSFGRYGRRVFDFQKTLDNFYGKQHPDGFICREIDCSNGHDRFSRFDPSSTGPNVLPWSEWDNFLATGDLSRLRAVFPPLLAYYHWFRDNRSWPDGTYFATGYSSGMDNQPRQKGADRWQVRCYGHGHLRWIDTCLQQLLANDCLRRMAAALGRDAGADLMLEYEQLAATVNASMWDETGGYYCDRCRDGTPNGVLSVGVYWALLTDIVPPERLSRLIDHLRSSAHFNRPHRVPSLAASHPDYAPGGEYWRGSVWAPTNYMVLRGLTRQGEDALAHEIARNHVDNVTKVFVETHTFWENYAPEKAAPGSDSKADLVGWSGLPPIAVLLEYVFGLRADVQAGELTYDVRLLEEHGVEHLPFGADGMVSIRCLKRDNAQDRPVVDAQADRPLTLKIRWAGGSERVALG